MYLRKRFGYKIYVYTAILVYIIIFSTVQIAVYYSFNIYAWDLGIFNQALWNTLHGQLFYYTAEPFYTRTGCFLGAHFSPILFLVIPVYAIYAKPETLLIVSTFVIAIGAVAAYDIAMFFLKNEKAAVILAVFYLLHPSLLGVTLCGFSLESFAATLFLFIIDYLIKCDFRKLAIVVPLGLMTHEASVPVIAFIGIYGMWHYHKSIKNKGFQASLIILAISVPYFFFAQMMRAYFGWTCIPSLWHEWNLIGANSPIDLPLKIVLNPMGALKALTFDGATKAFYAITLLIPTAFLSLLGLEGLIPAIPYLFITFFSAYPLYYSLGGHYGAFLAPFIFVSLIHGIIRLQKKYRFQYSFLKLAKIVIMVCIISLVVLLPSVYYKYGVFRMNDEHNKIIYKFLAYIPQNASVLTQSNIFPHISSRPNAYTIPPPTWGSQYRQIGKEMLLNLSKNNIEYLLLDFNSDPQYVSAAELIYNAFSLENSTKYELIVPEEDGVQCYMLVDNLEKQHKNAK